MNALRKVWNSLSLADPDEVAAYNTVLPRRIHVRLSKEGATLIATVDEVEGATIKGLLITEAQSIDELIENVNDLIYSYVDMPPKIRPYYGNRFQPENTKANTNKKEIKELILVKS